MKKKLVRIMLFVLVSVMFFTAFSCKKEVVQTGYLPDDVTEEDLEIKGKITFTVSNYSGAESEMTSARVVANAFCQKYPGTTVVVEAMNESAFNTRISAGDIGDVFYCTSSGAKNYHYTHNMLMPVDSYFEPLGINTADIYTGALDCGKFDGKQYMVPRNIALQILTFNKDMLEAAGIDYDGSYALEWEEFKNICRQVTQDYDGDGINEQIGCGLRFGWPAMLQVFLNGFGGQWVDEVTHTVDLTSAEVIKGFEEIVDGVNEGWLDPMDTIVQLGSKYQEMYKVVSSNSHTDVYTHICFVHLHDMYLLTAINQTMVEFDMDFDFCPMPKMPTHTVSCDAGGYAVYNRTTNPNTAAAFALFFLTEEGQRAYQGNEGGNVPLIKSLAEDDFWRGVSYDLTDKNYDAFLMYAEETKPVGTALIPLEVEEILSTTAFNQAIANALNGITTVQDAFAKLEKQANEKWAQIAG